MLGQLCGLSKNQRPFFCYGFILSSVLKTRSTAQLPLWHEQQILPCLEESGCESSAQDTFKPFLLKSTWWDGRVVVRQSHRNWWHSYCWGKNEILIGAHLTSTTNNTLHCWKSEVILSVYADVFIKCLNGLEYSRDAFIQISLYYYCRDKPPKAVVPNPVSGALPTCKVQLQPSFSTSACNYQVLLKILKGSYDVAKKNIILCIWCNAMWLWFKVQKTQYFPHTVHHCCSSMLRLSETRRFLQSSSFWEARRALIGQLSSALCLAEYLKRETEMLCPSPYCDATCRHDKTKTIKPIINEAFVAFSEDINYWL